VSLVAGIVPGIDDASGNAGFDSYHLCAFGHPIGDRTRDNVRDALELVDTLRPELGSVDYVDMHGAGEGLEFAREVKHWSWYTINER